MKSWVWSVSSLSGLGKQGDNWTEKNIDADPLPLRCRVCTCNNFFADRANWPPTRKYNSSKTTWKKQVCYTIGVE